MKQITYIILAAMLLLCGGFGYERLMADRDTDMNRKGELSDIAESVTAIPLKPINGKSLTDAHDIQKDGNDLFLICQGILYRFNRQGELVCQITQPEEIKVAGYLVHSLKKQLIVLGNVDDIYYYTFDGELLFKKKLRKDFNEEQLLSAVLYKGKNLYGRTSDRKRYFASYVLYDKDTCITRHRKAVWRGKIILR